ncbi:MAG: STAS domain-containing protein [Acidimicrobiia bacterium]
MEVHEGWVPMLKVEQRRAGDCLTVRVRGELDGSNAGVLRTALAAVGDDELVLVDLREVPFMDAAALGALIGGIGRLRAGGTAIGLCVQPGAVQRILAVSGFDQVVRTFPSLQTARVEMGRAPAAAEVASR